MTSLALVDATDKDIVERCFPSSDGEMDISRRDMNLTLSLKIGACVVPRDKDLRCP
jgi:hypothetical protein